MPEITLSDIALRFAVALVLSSLIGIERERKGRAAGLRTHVLVCFGATLMMMTGQVMGGKIQSVADMSLRVDATRIAAGIITGIGFLGAGTIMNEGVSQRGLTTAAMIWFVAALGVAVGAGEFPLAVCSTAFALVSVIGFEFFERKIASVHAYTLNLRVQDGLKIMDPIESMLHEEGFRVLKARLKLLPDKQMLALTYEITTRRQGRIETVAERLQHDFPAVQRVEIER